MKTTEELEKLSDDELKVLLAELQGFYRYHELPLAWLKEGESGYFNRNDLPNYPHDLNATASVKATLTKRQKEVFIDILDGSIMAETDPTKYIGYIETSPDDIFDRFNNASARKETIALILTLQPHE